MENSFDSRAVVFAFAPGDHVTIAHLGQKWKGRVSRCIHTASERGLLYEVEFIVGEDLKCREFWDDELETREK